MRTFLVLSLVAGGAVPAAAASPAAEWHLDESSWDGGVRDTSGNHHDGRALGGATPIDGHGHFPNLPGCTSCAVVDVPGDLGLGGAAAITVSAWVRWSIDPEAAPPRAVIVSQSSTTTPVAGAATANAGLFWIRLGGSPGSLAYQFGARVGKTNVFATGMTPPRQGVWTHVTGVFDGISVSIYVDGALEGTVDAPGVVAAMRPEYRMQVGAAPVDEGGSAGRRAFSGDVNEVRVYAAAVPPDELRTTACASGPPSALATFCGTDAPLCSGCLDLTLVATRSSSNSRSLTASLDVCRPVRVAVPRRLGVLSGKAGLDKAVLTFGDVSCQYAGDGSLGYDFTSCSDGAVAGAPHVTSRLGMQVRTSTDAGAATRVGVTLEEVGATPVLRLTGPAEGSYVDADVTLAATAAGAGGPLVETLDGAPYSGAAVGIEGLHVFTATAPGCHQPGATASLSFTIDRTAPAIQVIGVRDGEVREGPVQLAIVATDASPIIVIPSIDGLAFEGTTARIAAPGEHVLGVSAIDGAGHFTTTRTTFTIVELRIGVGEVPVVTRTSACSRFAGSQSLEDLCNDPCMANGVRGGTSIDVSEASCYDVCTSGRQQDAITLDRCEDRRWLDSWCGRIEQGRWNAVVNAWIAEPGQPPAETSVCADLKAVLDVAGGEATVAIPSPPPSTIEPRLLPQSVALGDGSVKDNGPRSHVANVAHFATTMPGMFHSGGTSTFGGIRRGESIRASSVSPIITGAQLLTKARRAQWEANGDQVMSCEEYVYERHYNVNKFYDEVERHGSNFRAYVNAAYAPAQAIPLGSSAGSDLVGSGNVFWPGGMLATQVGATVSLPPAYALGTMGELGWPFRSRTGTPTTPAHRLEDMSPHYKNVFFSMPTRSVNATEEDVAALIKGLVPGGELPCSAELGGLSWLGVCDQDLADRVQQGNAISVDRTWAWHRQKSDELGAQFSDEDLYLADQMEERFQQLLDWRARITGRILYTIHSAEEKGFVTLPAPDLPWNIYTSPTDLALVASQTKASQGVQSALAAHPLAAGTTTSSIIGGTSLFQSWTVQEQPLVELGTLSPVARIAPIMGQRWGSAEQAHLGAVGGALVEPVDSFSALQQRVGDLWRELYTVDALIETALHEAEQLGCLELQGPNPCDWSPREFAQMIQSFTEPDHEGEYATCVQNTAKLGFADLAAGRPLGIIDQVNSDTPIPVHYAGFTDGSDAVLAVGMRYQPSPGAAKVSKVFPQVRGNAFTDVDGNTTFDATSCVLDPAGEPYTRGHQFDFGGLPANPECPGCNVWTKDTDTLDLYFECLDLFKQLVYHAVVAKIGPILDETGRAKLGSSTAENESTGNGDWSLDYGYNFGWTFGNFEQFRADPASQCLLQPEMYGAMHFGAHAMGSYVNVFHGSAHARTLAYASDPVFEAQLPVEVVRDAIDAHVDLVVLSVDVVAETQKGGTFSIVAEDEERDEGLVPDPPITVPFAIGPVPMSLKAGLSGYVGVRYGAKADTDPLCQHQSLSAHFGPFAGIEGFASVGIDIVVAEAGVKISITIVEVDLPFTESVGLTQDPQNGLSAYFNTNLDLVLKTLGGRFSVFLRLLFFKWEWDLFTWDGFVHKVNLMHTETQVPLLPLVQAVNAISGAAPHMP